MCADNIKKSTQMIDVIALNTITSILLRSTIPKRLCFINNILSYIISGTPTALLRTRYSAPSPWCRAAKFCHGRAMTSILILTICKTRIKTQN